MQFPVELRYTETHEWARREGKLLRVGITEHAQHEISDVVFVELPKLNVEVVKGKSIAVVESVKAAFDIYAPASGKILQVNAALESNPALVNKDPYGRGWFFELELKDPSEWDSLLTSDQYRAQCASFR